MPNPRANPVQTEHPHIVTVDGPMGREPIIADTRIRVAFIARFYRAGEEPEEIVASYPHLKPAAVYDAISYYLDHQDEIDRLIEQSTPEALAERFGYVIDEHGKIVFNRP